MNLKSFGGSRSSTKTLRSQTEERSKSRSSVPTEVDRNSSKPRPSASGPGTLKKAKANGIERIDLNQR